MKSKLFRFFSLLFITCVFTFLVINVDKQQIGPADTVVGFASINGWFHQAFPYNDTFYTVSKLLGYVSFLVIGCFGLVGLFQLVKRKSLAKVDKQIILLGCLYVVTAILYVLFEKVVINYRPVIMVGETVPEASFPSSHTLLAVVVFGSAPTALRKLVSDNKTYTLLKVLFICLAVLMVVSRLLSGVHWLTDIIAGVLIASTLLFGYIALAK